MHIISALTLALALSLFTIPNAGAEPANCPPIGSPADYLQKHAYPIDPCMKIEGSWKVNFGSDAPYMISKMNLKEGTAYFLLVGDNMGAGLGGGTIVDYIIVPKAAKGEVYAEVHYLGCFEEGHANSYQPESVDVALVLFSVAPDNKPTGVLRVWQVDQQKNKLKEGPTSLVKCP
jgi:hypothetical protein